MYGLRIAQQIIDDTNYYSFEHYKQRHSTSNTTQFKNLTQWSKKKTSNWWDISDGERDRILSTTFYNEKKTSVKTCMNDHFCLLCWLCYQQVWIWPSSSIWKLNNCDRYIDLSKQTQQQKWTEKNVWMKGSVFRLHIDVNLTLCM